jgi:hypothetical protein
MSLPERYRQLREEGNSPTQAWAQLKEEYFTQCRQEKPQKDLEQSWKSVSGGAFEEIVLQEFAAQLGGLRNLKAERWKDIPKELKEPLSEKLWVRGEIYPVTAESNVDFVAYELDDGNTPKRIVAVYSCKVSLRERFQQDLFWAERLRGRGIRFCFITLDNDNTLTKAAKTGELTRKEAKMSVAVYDRIYLLCSETEILHYTRVFRAVSRLGEDLIRWQELD